MISFKNYLKQFKKKYVALNFTKETEENLYNYAIANGFDLSAAYDNEIQDPKNFKFHTTIFYSTTVHNLPNNTVNLEKPIKLRAKKLELLGPDKNIPVLVLETTDDLLEIRQLFQSQGMGDAWKFYIPHVSLSYVRGKYPIENMDLPTFNIVAESFSISDQS